MLLFRALCRSPEGAETRLEAVLENADGATSYDRVTLRAVRDTATDTHSYRLAQPVGHELARTGSFDAQILLSQAAPLGDFGLLGFKPHSRARLTGARIVVRPSDREGGHSSEHPYFALYLDWTIEAKVGAHSGFSEGNAGVGAELELVLTAGFSCIHPPDQAWELGARALQLRLDLDFLAATTGWFPLPLIDGGFGSPFAMPGLRDWFSKLAGQAGDVTLPDWTADFRLPALLPLGLRFKESHVALAKGPNGGYMLDARATGLVLEWAGERDFHYTYDGAEFSLHLNEEGNYLFTAVLCAAQYPVATATGDRPPWQVGLPFGALTVSAAAWRITAGLVAHGTPVKMCPELVIEIAGVSLASELFGDGKPIWRAEALRLHLRGRSLLCCPVADGKLLFERVAEGNWLARYRDTYNPRVPRWSGAAADPSSPPEEKSPVEFVDGAFDPDGHVLLLWKQNSARLLERLGRLVPGLKPEPASSEGQDHYVAIELARFDGPAGRDLQARIEWRAASDTWPAPSNTPLPPGPPPTEICVEPVNGTLVLNLPAGGTSPPAPIVDPAIRLDLPLIELAVARPAARSLLFYRPADEAPSLSLLHIYTKAPGVAVQPIAYAAIDLSLSDGGDRELLPTIATTPEDALLPPATPPNGSEPFLAVGLGSRADVQALAVLSWRQGDRPQILRAFEADGQPFRPLIPATMPADSTDCAGCPSPPPPRPAPLQLHPGRFGTPDVAVPAAGWTFAVQVAAERALRSFFPTADSTKSLVEFKVEKVCYKPEDAGGGGFLPPLRIHAELSIKLDLTGAGAKALEGKAVFRFDPSDMSLRLVEGGVFDFEMETTSAPDWARELEFPIKPDDYDYSGPLSLFGLEATFYQPKENDAAQSAVFLTLDLRGGRFALGLADGARCVLRYTDLGGGALTFDVAEFLFGPGGLDVEAALVPSPLKVKGLSNPFQLESAQLSMIGSRMRRLSVSASGKLPEILSSAPVSVTLTLSQAEAGAPIDLDELSCKLENEDEPIFTAGLRYRFEITALSLRYAREASGSGGRHFFFEVTGSAQFQPEAGEFDGGILEKLKSARVEFTRAPLSDEFTDHLTFIVELNEPVTFEVFKIFRMEIRSFGFAPKYDFPGGQPRPALIIGGQCEFADIGDVISAEIDFHRMYLGLPARGRSRPQVDFKNLRVEIRSAAGFRIGGTVASYDDDKIRGFKGDGFVAIPGFPQIGAAFAFTELRLPDGKWKRAWFIAVEASAISYQIAPLPIFLRQVGMGFGYRYTSVLLREQPEGQSLAELVDYLLAALDQHQTLARIESWIEDPETSGPPRWSIAMEGVLTLGTTQPDPFTYKSKDEQTLRTVVLQMMAAMNLNGLVAGAKVWFPVSFDDFLNDRHDMRRRPMAKGFIHFSPRQQRLLTYARKEKNAYYGPPDDPLTDLAKTVLEPVPYEYAALVEPGRVRGEIGWVDRLVFPLSLGLLKLECRGGILYAVEKGTAVFGLYFSARGGLGLSGGAGGGSLGLRVSAHADVKFATRLMIAQPLLRPQGSSVYAQVGLDINVRFSVEAWFKFKVGFVKVRLSLSFSISLQVLVALEIGMANAGNLGFKARATVVIGVFGRRLRASIAVGVNDSAVDRARDILQPLMSSMLEPGKIPPVPGSGPQQGTERLAGEAELPALAALPAELPEQAEAEQEGTASEATEEFAFAVIPVGPKTAVAGADRYWLLWIMPTPQGNGFYPVPKEAVGSWASLSNIPVGAKLFSLDPGGTWVTSESQLDLHCDLTNFFPAEGEGETPVDDERLTLLKAFAGCYKPEKSTDRNFPFDYEVGEKLEAVEAETAEEVIEDDRILQGPRHVDPVLNPTHYFDAALAAEMAARTETTGPQAGPNLEEQALGTQAFLLSTFQDDINAYLEKAGSAPPPPPGAFTKPTIWDTGMVLLLQAPELPAWARKRDESDRPKLIFKGISEHGLQPIVEPEAARVSDGNVLLKEPPVAHFDEELLALSWKIDWRDKPPATATGISQQVDDFIQYYRIQLFDLSGSGDGASVSDRPLVQRLNKRVNFLARIPKDPDKPGGENALVELRRYSFTIPVDEIFPKAEGDQALRRVLAVVTPVGQAGEEGEPFSIAATQERRLTPLPADEAELDLLEATDGFAAQLCWKEPALPNRGAVAPTDQWELVLRKLPRVPLGHYPQAAAAAGDEGGTLAFDRNVRPGDLIVRMEKDNIHSELGDDGRRGYKLSLPDGLKDTGFEWLDHEGQPLPGPTATRHKDSFLNRSSAAHEGGYAWQLFLRARHDGGDATGPATYSSVAAVRMFAKVKLVPTASGSSSAAEQGVIPKLPLQHFEWPASIGQARPKPPGVTAGFLHVPLADFDQAEPMIAYCPSRDSRRVVSAKWSGFLPAQPRAPHFSLPACAGFRLFEAVEDGLTNKDVAGRAAARPAAFDREIAAIDAIDAGLGGATPDTLVETQNWLSWSPAQRSILTWLDRVGTAAPAMSPDARRSWYSWSDADLIWPPHPGAWDQVEKVLPRENLHPLLAAMLLSLKRDWADPEGFALEAAAGKPDVEAGTHFEWMQRNTEALDPHGWAALWHLGLAVELSARDAVSGRGVKQAELRTRCEAILKSLLSAHESFAPLARHVTLDCPLRPNSGIAAKAEKVALKVVALDRIQIALRPVVKRLDEYCLIQVSADFRRIVPAAASDREPHPAAPGLRVLRFDDATDEVGFIPLEDADATIGTRLLGLMQPGMKLLLKFPVGAWTRLKSLLESLQSIESLQAPSGFQWVPSRRGSGERLFRFEHVARPLSLGPPRTDAAVWPHGRFPFANPTSAPACPNGHDGFRKYLSQAPLTPRPEDIQEDGTRRRARDIEPEELEKICLAYHGWAHRFFAAAPLWESDAPSQFRFSNANAATAAPRSEAVDVLAPSRDGTYRVNRMVNWQWATTRSLCVAAIGRYDGLLRQMERSSADADDSGGTAGATAFHLPRIRRLEPPQLLGERIVRGDDGRDYHELVAAIHEEDVLQQANVAVARQLEFMGSRIRFRREFRFEQWAIKLGEIDERINPDLSSPKGEWIEQPRFGASDGMLLATVPAARFGATATMLRCEPFFYATTAELQAASATVDSPLVERRLAYSAAAEPQPEGDPPLKAAKESLAWKDPIKTRYAAWVDAFGPIPEALSAAMQCWQLEIAVRFPRYFESLRGNSRDDESSDATVGALPDSEASLHVARATAGAEEPICLLRPDEREDNTFPFELLKLSPDWSVALGKVNLSDWHQGVRLVLGIRPSADAPSVDAGDGCIVADLPLPQAEEASLFEPARLPAWGPLANLAPLALRLLLENPAASEAAKLRFFEPFPLARFIARPLTGDPNASLPAQPGDVMLGLRLLLDTERMAAAKAAVHRADEPPERAFCGLIEQAAGAACRRRPADGIPDLDWQRWKESGLSLSGLRPVGGIKRWVTLDDPPSSDIELLIACVTAWSMPSEQDFDTFLALDLADAAAARGDVAAIKLAGTLSLKMTDALDPQLERVRRLQPEPGSISAWVQRGNDLRSFWGGRQA